MTALLDTFTKASFIQRRQSSNENIKLVNKKIENKNKHGSIFVFEGNTKAALDMSGRCCCYRRFRLETLKGDPGSAAD